MTVSLYEALNSSVEISGSTHGVPRNSRFKGYEADACLGLMETDRREHRAQRWTRFCGNTMRHDKKCESIGR
jgi:hypothetical protein